MKFNRIYRHGDIILFKLKEEVLEKMQQTGYAPTTKGDNAPLKGIKDTFVLAEGEVTGHAHRLKGKIEVLEQKVQDEQILFKVHQKTTLSHEEHATLVLEKGTYLKVQQVEYDPFNDLIVHIRD